MNAVSNSGTSLADTLISQDGENLILVIGAPRSGTTWLGKIFDSHPQVVYRHEPDTVVRSKQLPYLCSPEEATKYRDEARRYLTELVNVRTLKAAGSLPLFPKQYRGAIAHRIRKGFVYSLHLADSLLRGQSSPRKISIPDLVTRAPGPPPVIVLKSVISRGRARVFAEAFPKLKVVFVLRHPCGQAVSMLRGIASGKFEQGAAFDAVLTTEEGQALGITPERFAALSPMEKCAWHWAIMNQKALNDLANLKGDRLKVLRYEDACIDPERVAKDLIAFGGLNWSEQNAAFVQKSTMGDDTHKFYGTTRDSLTAANKWRTALSTADQRCILDIVARFPVGGLFASMA